MHIITASRWLRTAYFPAPERNNNHYGSKGLEQAHILPAYKEPKMLMDASDPHEVTLRPWGKDTIRPPPARRPLHPVSVLLFAQFAFILGLLLQVQQESLWPLWICLTVIGAAIMGVLGTVLLILKGKWGKTIATALVISAFVLGFAYTALRAHYIAAGQISASNEGVDTPAIVTITTMPRATEYGYTFMARLAPIIKGEAVPVRLVRLSWYQRTESGSSLTTIPQAGQRWRMTLRLRAVHGTRNPHGFDYERYAWQRGIGAVGYVRSGKNDPPPILIEDRFWHSSIERFRAAVIGRIQSTLERSGHPEAIAGLLAGLTVGEQGAISDAHWAVFRNTGVAHLVSISGVHITMFAWLTKTLLMLLWRWALHFSFAAGRWGQGLSGPALASIGGLMCALAYALLSGFAIPAQRTLLMLATFTGLSLLGLRWPWYCTWLLTLFVVTLLDPYAILEAGFWLSFVAVAVLFASEAPRQDSRSKLPDLGSDIPAHSSWYQGLAVALAYAKRLWHIQRQQSIITLALAPLTLLFFQQISLISLVANLLAIPWVTLVVTPLSLIGIICSPFWHIAAWATAVAVEVLSALATLPWAVYTHAAAPLWLNVLAIAGTYLAIASLPLAIRVACLGPLLTLLLWEPKGVEFGHFQAVFLDVGQGSAVHIQTEHHHLLYDTGPQYGDSDDAGARIIVPYLQAAGITLDTIVVSHTDKDHAGGEASIRRAHPQAQVIGSGYSPSAKEGRRCIAGHSWTWDGVHFAFLHPKADFYPQNPPSNALSCVLRISNARHSVLLTGDIPHDVEAQITRDFAPPQATLRADILLAPHHGSASSSSALFLDHVQASTVVIQSGYRNRYGHPHPRIVQRYLERQTQIIDSVSCGAWTWRSDAPQPALKSQCQRLQNRRYWQHLPPQAWSTSHERPPSR